MITRGQKITISVTSITLIFLAIFFTFGTNPFLHLIYSDDYMLKTAMNSEIVQAFHETYPDSEVRSVRVLEQAPAIVFEKTHDQKMAFLAVGNFEGKNLTYMYKCFSYDYRTTFFDVTPTSSANDIFDNPCFT